MNAVTPIALCVFLFSCAEQAPPIELTDLAGRSHVIPAGGEAPTLLFFVTTDCPISNGYAPEMERIASEFQDRGVHPFLVHVDPDSGPEALLKHTTEYGFSFPVVVDRQHRLVQETGATMTPEAVVMGSDGIIYYRGRINDQYADLGVRRPAATKHDLREALDAVLAGDPVEGSRTQAIGCFISDLEPR